MDLIQWHPTFFADVQVELRKESEKLSFQSEYQLSKKPMEIDVLIIKKKTEEPIEKNIGRIFRKYNIVEYDDATHVLVQKFDDVMELTFQEIHVLKK